MYMCVCCHETGRWRCRIENRMCENELECINRNAINVFNWLLKVLAVSALYFGRLLESNMHAATGNCVCVCVMRHCNHRWRFHLLTTVLHTDLIATVMHIKKENHQRSLNFSSPINIHIFMNAPRPDAMHTNTDMESQKCCGENGIILVVFELRAQFVQVLMKTAVKKACLWNWNWNWHHLLVDVRQHDRLMSERQKFKLMMLLNCRFEIDIERARKNTLNYGNVFVSSVQHQFISTEKWPIKANQTINRCMCDIFI